MKVIIVALAFVAVAAAAAVEPPTYNKEPPTYNKGPDTRILRSEFEQSPEGPYSYGFETDDGTSRSEQGEVKSVPNEKNEPQNVIVVRGFYTYTDPEGKVETVNYVADEGGYRAEGPSIPKAAQAAV